MVILVAGVFAVRNFYLRPDVEPASIEKMAFPLPDKPSIAVLPFTNMSGDPEQEYFSDGITDQIITSLSIIPRLFVVARNSTFAYKGKTVKVQKVAEELGVRYVLEGSVQRSEDRIRILVQLIDATTGHHLWSERYDRDLKDLFALQDEIAMEIMTTLQVKLTEGEYARVLAGGTSNLEAMESFWRAEERLFRLSKEDNAEARRWVEKAIELDPNFSGAWAIKGYTHLTDVVYGFSKSPVQSIRRAEECAQKAITLDDSNAKAYALLGRLRGIQRKFDQAIEYGEKAVALNPNDPHMLLVFAITMHFNGRFEESIALLKKAMRLSPYYPAFYLATLAPSYVLTERYEEAIATSKLLLDRSRKGEFNPLLAHLYLAEAYIGLGHEDKARANAEEVLKINPNFSLKSFRLLYAYRDPIHSERRIAALSSAGLPKKPPLPLPDKPSIAVLPFVNMSGDPEQEYFVDGMTNSVFRYKGKPVDVKKVSRELGVKHVLEGSVRKAGDQVRINAQLIDASTGGHLWAERYDGHLGDVFALQDKITHKIVTALAVKLTGGEQEKVAHKDTDSIAAYDAFLKGWEHYLQRTPDDFAKAISYFEKAIELDSEYRRAYAALAKTYWSGSQLEVKSKRATHVSYWEARMRAREYLRMAMKNPTSIAHTLSSEMNLAQRLHEEAIAEAQRAIDLDPNDSDSRLTMAKALIFAGRQEEALDFVKKAMRLDPHNIAHPLYLRGLARFAMGQLDEAVASIERALRHNPEISGGAGVLAVAYAHLGRDQEAQAALDKYFKRYLKMWEGGVPLSYEMYFWPFKDPEAAERFADGLLKAGLPGQPSAYYKVSEEHRLDGKEIRSLFFGRTVTSWPRLTNLGKEHLENRTKEGKATWRGAPDDPWGQDDTGTSWIEGDMLCNQWQMQMFGIKHCMTVFRNPEGTLEKEDEYLAISDFGIHTFSPVD
jgi:TolB-like protein/Flp pilus assembly protein TadD